MSFLPGITNSILTLPQGANSASMAADYAKQMAPTDYSGIAGAGIQAAGTTISTLAQIMAQSAARQQAMQTADANRATTADIAKMQIRALEEGGDRERKFRAQQMLIQALGAPGRNALASFDTQRAANRAGSSLIAQAFSR